MKRASRQAKRAGKQSKQASKRPPTRRGWNALHSCLCLQFTFLQRVTRLGGIPEINKMSLSVDLEVCSLYYMYIPSSSWAWHKTTTLCSIEICLLVEDSRLNNDARDTIRINVGSWSPILEVSVTLGGDMTGYTN
jgi:hypothetical protein